jgi:RNA polymerase-binding transcription factor DksA
MSTKPKKSAPAKKPTAKPAPAKAHKPAAAAKPVAKPAAKAAPAPAKPAAAEGKTSARADLRARLLGAKKNPAKPIAFSLDEVRAIAKTVSAKEAKEAKTAATAKPAASKKAELLAKAKTAPHHVKAASLSDILGFNPRRGKSAEEIAEQEVPEKFKRYHRLLLDLRKHLTAGIELHSEETLKRSSKEDAGDLSSYGQHMADAGTDTFDRDFALSLVSSEQEALTEIDAAIKRIHDGSYGVCEISQKPIAKERLLAVPFTRYTAEAQKQLERNRHRARTQAGLFGELGEEGGKRDDDGGGGDE